MVTASATTPNCAPGDGSAFAVPGEIQGVSVHNDGTVSWSPDASGTGTGYDVWRESVTGQPVGGAPDGTCLADGQSSTQIDDGATPAAGDVYLYLVRPVNACGAGDWGVTSSGTPRDVPCGSGSAAP